MTLAQIVVLIYGIFSLVGGVIGFLKAKSKASLIAGTISGVVFLICAKGIGNGITAAYLVALLVSLALGIRFFKTWRIKKKVMPDLIMIVLSALSSISILLEMLQ